MASGLLRAFTLAAVAFVAALAETKASERIQRISQGLLPPVIVKGEPVQVSTLEARMKELGVPGLSVAVISQGKLDWARGFGVTREGGAPVTPETLFQAASITKPVVTVAALTLVQAGKIDLDADVNRYLKSWKVPSNELTQQAPVTMRGLLTHAAGVTVHGFRGYSAGAPLPTLVQILDGEPPANSAPIRVDILPGSRWRYSGGGFQIAEQLLTDVIATPFPEFMQASVLRPLRMRHSTFEQPLPRKFLARAAWPHRGDGSEVPGGPHTYPELAAAGLWTTPSDLARFAIEIQQALAGKSQRVISTATARQMLEPAQGDQAIGFISLGTGLQKSFNHGGSNAGYRTFLVAYENGDGAVFMTNSDSGDPLIRQVLRTIAKEYAWQGYAPPEYALVATDTKAFDGYVGAYRFFSGDVATFWREGTQLRSRVWGYEPTDLFATSPSEYIQKTADVRWVFSDGPGVTLYENGFPRRLIRIDDPQGREILEMSLATEKRFAQQQPAPAGEAALRRIIADLASGQPRYEELRPSFAETIRLRLPILQQSLTRLGPIRSTTFKGVGPAGDDTYNVKFANGEREFQVMLEPDGQQLRAIQFTP